MMLDDVGCSQPRVFLQTNKMHGELGFVLLLYSASVSYKLNLKLLRQGMASLLEHLFIAATFVKTLMIITVSIEGVTVSTTNQHQHHRKCTP